MPVIIEGGRVPTRWAEKQHSEGAGSVVPKNAWADGIRIALVNNMPDAALEDTELQFFELLNTASGDIPVRVKLYSLPGLARGERGHQHLHNFYFGMDDLWNSRCDALIMTGTEPRQPNLRDEPYWHTLTDILDWAEQHTVSAILSCLAAHAGVLHSDRIERRTLGDKQFGVFEFKKTSEHILTSHTEDLISFPHSRWNGLPKDALTACGYSVLLESTDAGVDSFVKRKGKSLFLHFQGHPEYGAKTLLKEYERDIKRFLKGERETYPSMPHGYFDAAATRLLTDFREHALAHRQEESMASFPVAAVADTLQNGWNASATRVYRNWLEYVASGKTDTPPCSVMARVGRS
jgi:homoserine O-succinyltransferase/O-acetyltransferase